MQPRQVLYLAILSILTVFAVTAGWEFVIEDIVEWDSTDTGGPESLRERWQYVVTATCAAAVAWAVSGPVLLRITAERNRAERRLRESYGTLDQKVRERTTDLENEIAQRAQAERALAESEARYRAIVEDRAEPLCRTLPDGTLTFVNESYCRNFDKTREELVGRNFLQFMPEAGRNQAREAMARMSAGSPIASVENRAVDPDGTESWSEWTVRALRGPTGEIEQFQAAARDITERKQAEIALRDSEERIRLIADALPGLITYVDAGQRIRFANKAYAERLGLRREDIVGKLIREVRGEAEYRAALPSIEKVLAGQELTFVAERNFKTSVSRHYLTHLMPHVGERGEVLGYFVLMTDITNQRQAEMAMQTAMEAAEQADRAKSEFLANMSHELRTPMNAILGFSEMIENQAMGPVGSPKYLEYAKDIHLSGQHLLDLINDILDLSKVESGQASLDEEEIVTPELANSVLALVKGRADQGKVAIETEFPGRLPTLRADARKLRQILLNLLSNAVKFTDPGGKVTLTIRSPGENGYIFEIADTGIGMANEDIPMALAPFGQVESALHRKYEGTGLGLPLTKAIVELHGGSLDIRSQPGTGTTVTVRFPAERVGTAPARLRKAAT